MAYDSLKGRHLLATRDLKAGELVFKEPPVSLGPVHDVVGLQCLGCFRPVKINPLTAHSIFMQSFSLLLVVSSSHASAIDPVRAVACPYAAPKIKLPVPNLTSTPMSNVRSSRISWTRVFSLSTWQKRSWCQSPSTNASHLCVSSISSTANQTNGRPSRYSVVQNICSEFLLYLTVKKTLPYDKVRFLSIESFCIRFFLSLHC